MPTDPRVADAHAVVRYLIDRNEPHAMIQCSLGEDIAGLTGEQCDEALVVGEELGWLTGEISERASGSSLWLHLFVTVAGMRQARAWPPAGREYLPGPWDGDHWGTWARPCMQRLASDPDWATAPASFGMGPIEDDARNYLALRLLAAAGYIDARVGTSSVSMARLTLQGGRAVDGSPLSHLERARVLLSEASDISRALIDLVEGEIAEIVERCAEHHGEPLLDRTGKPLTKLRQKVDRLDSVDALDKVDAAILRVALEARNIVGHTTTDEIAHSAELVSWIIDGVEFVDRHVP